uniref:Insulin-degrading enzyme n=1 Tax=Spongospora subterranea TaxID=70186 RepID=A0A0H5R9Q4_9EUKA|eukprot:CRZ10860.1 hypothetical protein [Spongospora subterranea]
MEVGVGHFSDPDDLPGLAHFLEHMLFLGTAKYPDENSFSGFLSQHSGSSNAYTASENTSYHFEIIRGFLSEALDRFAQFFVHPLFTESATDRELKAVENEHQKNSQSDMWRFFQLLKSTANQKGTPFTKFGTGNYETLSVIPKQQGIDTRTALLTFYNQYYSANLMYLCVLGAGSLDEIEEQVKASFSSIENRGLTAQFFPGPVFDEISFCRMYYKLPVKDNRSVQLVWELPSTEGLYRLNPSGFLSHLIGHEAEGSILSALKSRSWATGLSSGESFSATGFAIFTVSIEVSIKGLDHVNDIISIVFEYIRLLQRADSDILQRLYLERKQIGEIKFRFKGKERPSSLCSELSRNLHKVRGEDVLSAHYLYHDFDEATIRTFASFLTPERARFEVESQSFSDRCNSSEKWYGTLYHVDVLEEKILQLFNKDTCSNELHLPRPNNFIASDFHIKTPMKTAVFDEAPLLVQDDDRLKLWVKTDTTFGKPKLNVMAMFYSIDAYCSPRSAVLCQLYCKLVTESLTEFSYNAELAGLSFALDPNPAGIELHVRGYNEKLHVLLERIIDPMAKAEFDPARFELIRESVKRAFINFELEQPYHHSLYHQAMATELPKWSTTSRIAEIDNISFEDVLIFARVLLSHGHWEVLIHGNTLTEDAIRIGQQLTLRIPLAPTVKVRSDLRVAKLPARLETLHTKTVQNPDEINSSILVYFQIGPDEVTVRAKLRLFAHLINEPCFNRLRTIETLGYLVFSGMQEQRGVLGFRFIVQSSEHSPTYLHSRIAAFVVEFRQIVAIMSIEDFQSNLMAVIANRKQKDKTLFEETKRLWVQIARHRYEFTARTNEAKELSLLTKGDMLNFIDNYIMSDGEGVRRFSALVFGSQHDDQCIPVGGYALQDFDQFKRSLDLFPCLE